MSSFSIDRWDVADLLIKAHRRGVHVQIVVNDHTAKTSTLPDETDDAGDPDAETAVIKPANNKAQKRLVKVLGQKRNKPSFIFFCKGSCRNGPGGNLHTKVYSFSSTGASKYVLISTSANLTYGAAFGQWNDAYTIRDDANLFRTWVKVFRQLKNDRKTTPRHIGYNSPDRALAFQRQLAAAKGGTTEVQAARACEWRRRRRPAVEDRLRRPRRVRDQRPHGRQDHHVRLVRLAGRPDRPQGRRAQAERAAWSRSSAASSVPPPHGS